MQGAQEANAYLNDREPWKTAKTDSDRTGTTLAVALTMIASAAVALSPFLPGTSLRVLRALGVEADDRGPRWEAPTLEVGHTIDDPGPLFAKVDLDEE